MPYADIIILALIAVFILLRLRSTLGQTDGENTPGLPDMKKFQADIPVVQVSEKIAKARQEEKDADDKLIAALQNDSTKQGIDAIKSADKDFSLAHFMEGAKGAFEMLFDAFTKGDKDALKMLLSTPLYEVFSAEVDKRATQEQNTETTLVSIISQELIAATMEKNIARISLRFVSEQVSVVRDKSGKIIEGNPSHAAHVQDEWTFEREIPSKNPNWKIIDT